VSFKASPELYPLRLRYIDIIRGIIRAWALPPDLRPPFREPGSLQIKIPAATLPMASEPVMLTCYIAV
jgi:hypothetical protein